jgi:hypothetical protein
MANPTGFHVCPDFEPVAFARNSGLLTYCQISPCRRRGMMQSGRCGRHHTCRTTERCCGKR